MMGYHACLTCNPGRVVWTGFVSVCVSAENLAYASDIITTLNTEYGKQAEGRRLVITSAFHLLVAFLCRLYSREKRETALPLTQMAGVASHIQKNYHETIRIEDLARIANLSVSQLQRKFKKIYNETPVQYINKLRIHEACEMSEHEFINNADRVRLRFWKQLLFRDPISSSARRKPFGL